MTLWAALARARHAPHRGVSAAALDSKFSLFFGFDLEQLRLTDFGELLQSGWVRGLYSAGRGGRGVIMFDVIMESWFSTFVCGLSGVAFLLGCAVGCLHAGFEQHLVTIVEDTHIELVVRLPTSSTTITCFSYSRGLCRSCQDVNASCFMKPNTN
jgi:hypothetical protein